jgi:DNA-binding transcriptional LysR family regulator
MDRRSLNLTGLAVAIRIAEDGTFAAASRALGLSTSATSKAVARLESDLGVKLFQRTTRRVRLTAEGERFLHGLRPLLRELDSLAAEISGTSVDVSGVLRISAPVTLGRVVIVPMLAKFRAAFPAIRVDLRLDDRMADFVRDDIDVTIRTGELADSSSIVARRISSDPLIVCATAAYLRRAGFPRTPDELVEHDCIGFRNSDSGRTMAWRFADGSRWQPDAMLLADDMESVARLAIDGAGIAQVPAYLVDKALANGALQEVLADFRPPAVTCSVLYLDRRFVAPRIRAFVDFVVDLAMPQSNQTEEEQQ